MNSANAEHSRVWISRAGPGASELVQRVWKQTGVAEAPGVTRGGGEPLGHPSPAAQASGRATQIQPGHSRRPRALPVSVTHYCLPAALDKVGHPFCHHYHPRVDGGAYQVGHDRRINDAQPFHAMHLPILIDYGQRVFGRSHFAGAGNVGVGSRFPQQPLVQRAVAHQVVVPGFNAFPQQGASLRRPAKSRAR